MTCDWAARLTRFVTQVIEQWSSLRLLQARQLKEEGEALQAAR